MWLSVKFKNIFNSPSTILNLYLRTPDWLMPIFILTVENSSQSFYLHLLSFIFGSTMFEVVSFTQFEVLKWWIYFMTISCREGSAFNSMLIAFLHFFSPKFLMSLLIFNFFRVMKWSSYSKGTLWMKRRSTTSPVGQQLVSS